MKTFTLLTTLLMLVIAILFLVAPTTHAQGPTPVATPTPAPANGTLEGQIVNATKDAPITSAANLTVTLMSATANMTMPITVTTRSDTSGKFTFSKLDTTPNTRYLLTTLYQDVDYFSEVLAFPANQNVLTATLPILETTTDAKVVSAQQTHFIINVAPGALSVLQIVVLMNSSDRAYIGKPLAGPHRATLNLPILAGARNLEFESREIGAATLVGDGVLTYTLPIYPGPDQIVYGYEVPVTSSAYPFNLKMPFDSAQFRVLFQDIGGTINSAQLGKPAPFVTQDGQKYLAATATNVAAGTTIQATFTNLSGTGESESGVALSPQLLAAIGLAIFAFGAGTGLTLFLRRNRSNKRRDELLKLIAHLDDQFETGAIDEARYQRRRDKAKEELEELGE